MRCFKFLVRSTLDAGSRRKEDERRYAHVWVNEKELEKAEGMARSLLAGQGWAIESVELSMAPTREEIAKLDPVLRPGLCFHRSTPTSDRHSACRSSCPPGRTSRLPAPSTPTRNASRRPCSLCSRIFALRWRSPPRTTSDPPGP